MAWAWPASRCRAVSPCEDTPGDLPGYNSIMMKALDGPAFSVTFTQFPVAHDPRLVVLEGGYCGRRSRVGVNALAAKVG
jgi:hypothetical protein